MNIWEHWKHFQKTDLNYKHLAYKKQSLVSDMKALNEKRQIIQKEMVALSSKYETCKNCPTSCCGGNYNHFTIVDHVLRMYSDNPISEFSCSNKKPPTLWTMIFEKMKTFMTNNLSYRGHASTVPSADRSGCPLLTSKGCSLVPQDRPIRCVLYTCRPFRASLSEADIKSLAVLTEELNSISNQTFDLYKR